MSQPVPSSPKPVSARAARRTGKPFFGVIESVIVEDPAEFEFAGAIPREHAFAAWVWMTRDLAPDLVDPEADPDDPATLAAFDLLLPDLLSRARSAVAAAGTSHDAGRKLRTQLGGEAQWRQLPVVLNALKCRNLLDKAKAFGRATNGMTDEGVLATALQSMPLSDPGIAALLMQAALGQIANPSRLMTATIRIAGAPTEDAVVRTGFAPLVDAILAHAQNQIPSLLQVGPFADMDLTCRAIDRFHRLIRAVQGYLEFNRGGRWAMVVSSLTKQVSSRVEPRLREVVMDVSKALRRGREGSDRLDSDQLLAALNGVYVMTAVRDARDSLALNALFDQTWTQVGEALETHIQRNLEILRQHPDDRNTSERLDASIKMAELRFNAEYAEVLRRAKDAAEKR